SRNVDYRTRLVHFLRIGCRQFHCRELVPETITTESLFPGEHGYFRSSRDSKGTKKVWKKI
ncbi:MAG: hypothetical protein WCJ47_08310, partial [Methanomicrobiales archaeon]